MYAIYNEDGKKFKKDVRKCKKENPFQPLQPL